MGKDGRSKSFFVHAINEQKPVVFRGPVEPTGRGLQGVMRRRGRAPKCVVLEAGHQRKWIATVLPRVDGVWVPVVHPNEVTWSSQSSGKTDKVDARKLAELACGQL